MLGDAVVIGMFLEGKCKRAQYEVCSEDADAAVTPPRSRECGMMTGRFTRTLLGVI